MLSKNYRATDLINICDMLEGKNLGSWDNLKSRLNDLIGLDFSLNGENFRIKLCNDIKNMMILDHEGKLQYKDF